MKKNLKLFKCLEQIIRMLIFIFTLLIMTQCGNKILSPINKAAEKKCFSFIDENRFLNRNYSIISTRQTVNLNGIIHDTIKYNKKKIFIYTKADKSENRFIAVFGWSKKSNRIDIIEYSLMRLTPNEIQYSNDYKCNQHYNNQTILPTLTLKEDNNKSKIWFSFSPPFLLFSQHMEIQPFNKEKPIGNQEAYYNTIIESFPDFFNSQRLFLVELKSLTELIELIPSISQQKIKKQLESDNNFTSLFLSYLNKNKSEFDYLMLEADILSAAFYSPYITNICKKEMKVTLLLNSCDKISYYEWEKILNENPNFIHEIGILIKNKYPQEFLNENQVSYLSNFYISNSEPLIVGNELKYNNLTTEIIKNSPRWFLPKAIEIISSNDNRNLALRRYVDLSKNKNEVIESISLYPEMKYYASKKASDFVSSIHDMKLYLQIFPKGFYCEKYNQDIYAYEIKLEKQRQKRIQRINNYLIIDQLEQMYLDGIEPLFILSKLKQISNEYPEDMTVVQLETLKHIRFVNQTSKAQNSKSGGIATFFRGTTFSHKSNVGSVYKNELVWVDDLKESYIGLITNPKKLVENILNNKYTSGYSNWARRVYTSDIGDYDKPVKVPPSARSQGASLSSGWYIMGALTGAYYTYTKGLQYAASKGYISSGSSSSDYTQELNNSDNDNFKSPNSASVNKKRVVDKNNSELQIIEDGTHKYGSYTAVRYKIICPNGHKNFIYYNEQKKCWMKTSSAFCDYSSTKGQEGLKKSAKILCSNN